MKLIRKTCAAALLLSALASPALAADLLISYNADQHSATVTSQLDTAVDLVSFSNGSETVSAGGTVPANGALTFPTSRDLPVGLNTALCRAASEAGIAGHEPSADGVYTVSVAVQ